MAASSLMEISPMAGKFWQPIHEPQHGNWKQASVKLNKQWKKEGNGWGKLPGRRAATPHNAASTRSKYTQERLKRRAHGIPTHVICKKPLTTREH